MVVIKLPVDKGQSLQPALLTCMVMKFVQETEGLAGSFMKHFLDAHHSWQTEYDKQRGYLVQSYKPWENG